jgi:hypothetical protein
MCSVFKDWDFFDILPRETWNERFNRASPQYPGPHRHFVQTTGLLFNTATGQALYCPLDFGVAGALAGSLGQEWR